MEQYGFTPQALSTEEQHAMSGEPVVVPDAEAEDLVPKEDVW